MQGRNFLLFWQTFLGASVLNFESGISHCGSAALRYLVTINQWPVSRELTTDNWSSA